MKRLLLAIGSLGLIALLGMTAIGGIANAQTPGNTSTPKREIYLAALATRLGISTESLQNAIQETNAQLSFGPGRIGGKIRDRMNDRRERVIDHIDLTDAAVFLGITEDELRTELQSGKTPIEIAEAHGKTKEEIRTFLIQQVTERIDARLAGETTAGPGTAATTGA